MRAPIATIAACMLLLAACAPEDSEGDTSEEPAAQEEPTTQDETAVQEPEPSIEDPEPDEATTEPEPETTVLETLAASACDDDPSRMDASAEAFTHESWQCSRGDEELRIDLFTDAGQHDDALEMTLSFYEDGGDERGLDELPFVCGDDWSIAAQSNALRDELLHELVAAELCS